MNIPSKVKIGGMIYDIKIINSKKYELTETKNWGLSKHGECKIILDINVNSQRLWQTFFHEILHVISIEYSAGLSEKNVDRISNGFYTFLTDNNLLKE